MAPRTKALFPSSAELSKSPSKMDVGQLRAYIAALENTLISKIQQQREILEGQLAGLQIYANNNAGAAVRALMRVPNTRTRAKAQAEIPEQEAQTAEVVGPRYAARMDA